MGLWVRSIGLAAVTKSEIRVALTLLLAYILEKKTAVEEKELINRYPTEYPEYVAKVKKFLPFIY
jgi:protein-S-isoprenylcysteine O-methyltransferase Ste14